MEFQLKKGYRPYEAYQYLEPGRDFKVIDWADWDWAGRNILPLNPEEEIRCRELLEGRPTSASTTTRISPPGICPPVNRCLTPCGLAGIAADMRRWPIPTSTVSSII